MSSQWRGHAGGKRVNRVSVENLARVYRTGSAEQVVFDALTFNVAQGETVALLLGSANRDERRIPDPDRFDVSRDPNPHLAFGFGAHYCLGASLARLEARVAFEELLARHPDYALAEARVERLRSGPLRGALRLPLALAA